ncbi:MAG: hypothetical protein ACR2GY_06545 [Phycisphaerales bacterium]
MTHGSLHSAPRITPPPRVGRNVGRIVVLIACVCAIIVATTIVMLSLLNKDAARSNDGTLADPFAGSPAPLDDNDVATAQQQTRRDVADYRSESDVTLSEGGWVAMYDENNRPVQMHRARKLLPKADGIFEMESPQAVIFMNDGRAATIDADWARVKRLQNNFIESGRLTGNVVIRYFEPTQSGTQVDYERDVPVLIVRTESAEMDLLEGTVNCPEEVVVLAGAGEFHGRDLVVLYDQERGLQSLRVQQATRPIRIVSASVDEMKQQRAADDASQEGEQQVGGNNAVADAPPHPDQEERIFEAVFSENVRLWQGGTTEQPATIARGDTLRVIFSTANPGLENASTRNHDVDTYVATTSIAQPILRLPQELALSIFAAVDRNQLDDRDAIVPQASEDDVYLAYSGELTIRPLRSQESADEPQLDDPSDVLAELRGTPVTLNDTVRAGSATCGLLTYDTRAQRVSLLSDDSFHVRITSEKLTANAIRFDYYNGEQRGEFIGPGMMHLADDIANINRNDDNDDSSGNDTSITIAAASGPDNAGFDIEWSRGVDLRFFAQHVDGAAASGTASPPLREVEFRGAVIVNESRFNLQTQNLLVAFFDPAEVGGTQQLLSSIDADGATVARGLDDQGGIMEADHLAMRFETIVDDVTGQLRSAPVAFTATGSPSARDATRKITAITLAAVLEERAEVSDIGETRRSIVVKEMRAVDEVEIQLEDGMIARGDLLVTDPDRETADLTGETVTVTGGERAVDFTATGTHAHVARIDGRGHVELRSPGAARIIDLRGGQREVIDVTWTDSLAYDEGRQPGTGQLVARGNVDAVSTSILEENRLRGVVVTMDFRELEASDDTAAEATDGTLQRRRELERLTLKGDARIESKSWQTHDHSDTPRIIYIESQHLEYDQRTMEAWSPGAGTLFLRDHRPREQPDAKTVQHLSGRGDTLFTWQGEMRMTQNESQQYAVVMDNDVVMLHQAPDDEGARQAQLTCGLLQVDLTRRSPQERMGGLDFGGNTELDRFDATRAVFVEAGERRIDCERLLYNASVNIAEIFGSPGDDAEVTTAGAMQPVRASSFRWDLLTDRVTVTNIRGGGIR